MGVKLPATGTGDSTPTVATEKIAGADFQFMKLVDGTPGGSQGAVIDASGNLRVALSEVGASVANFPANQAVSIASVAAGLGPLGASVSNFPALQPVSGYVGASVANLPNPLPVSGSVAVTNFPSTQAVAVASIAAGAGQLGASVSNFPALQPVSGYLGASVSNFPALQPVSGYLGASLAGGYLGASVSNFPATQPVSGYLGASVSNLPGTQPVSIASYAVTQPVSIASTAALVGASVSNFPAVQPVSGYLGASLAGGYVGASIANLPGTQPVSIASAGVAVGASVANFPSVQTVVGSTTNFGGSVTAYAAAAPSGGASPYHFIAGASVNNVNVKNGAATLYSVAAMNVNASPRYVKLYDKASTPSVGQDIPCQTYLLPGNSSGAGAVIPLPDVGMRLANGLAFGITGAMADTDQTAIAAADVVLNLLYV